VTARRRYSDDDRATALAALAANGGAVLATSLQLGIPVGTLERWANGSRHPEARQMAVKKKASLADQCEKVAWQLLKLVPKKAAEAPLNHVAVAFGIAVDKMRLLREQPTEITEEAGKAEDWLRELYEQVRLDRAAVAVRDAGPQPLPGGPPADAAAAAVPGDDVP